MEGKLVIESVRYFSKELVLIQFENSDWLNEWKPGQFITLVLEGRLGQLKRSYSLCSSPADGLAILVKYQPNGALTPNLFSHLKVGEVINAEGPFGTFGAIIPTLPTDSEFVFFAAGSGISAIFPLIKSGLQEGRKVTLFYAFSTFEKAAFVEELETLKRTNEKFNVTFFVSQATNGFNESILSGHLNNSFILNWLGLQKSLNQSQFFVCGPSDWMRMVTISLRVGGVDIGKIFKESFIIEVPKLSVFAGQMLRNASLNSNGVEETFTVQPGKTVLSAAKEAGISLPYSCSGGKCGSCVMQLFEGEIEQFQNEVLTDHELNDGLFLTCSAWPKSDIVFGNK